jgi:hypothetical protein
MAFMLREVLRRPGYPAAAFTGLLFMCVGIGLNLMANAYATERASNYVEDIILSNTPALNVDEVFVYGTFIMILFIAAVFLYLPEYIPFAAASLGVFYLIRTCFVTLTHLGPFPDRVALDLGNFLQKLMGGNDMFFSGHTGSPFLLALIFWSVTPLRYAFLAWSVLFAVVVLLGHLHYTIDVLSAFFITYTIFHICEYLFSAYRRFITT